MKTSVFRTLSCLVRLKPRPWKRSDGSWNLIRGNESAPSGGQSWGWGGGGRGVCPLMTGALVRCDWTYAVMFPRVNGLSLAAPWLNYSLKPGVSWLIYQLIVWVNVVFMGNLLVRPQLWRWTDDSDVLVTSETTEFTGDTTQVDKGRFYFFIFLFFTVPNILLGFYM